jgi:hypothetical protein
MPRFCPTFEADIMGKCGKSKAKKAPGKKAEECKEPKEAAPVEKKDEDS